MKKTAIFSIIAVLAAAAVVVGTLASPVFAFDSSTTTVQINRQTQIQSGFVNLGSQEGFNCISVLSGANSCQN